MKRYNKIIFYYTLAAVTVLLFGSVFFLPLPFRYIQAGILVPPFIFFWLKFTSPGLGSPNAWSARVLSVVVLLAAVGTYGYFLSAKMLPQPKVEKEVLSLSDTSDADEASVSAQLSTILTEIEALKDNKEATNDEIVEIFNELENENTPTPLGTPAGLVEIVNKTEINVYGEPNTSARILGVAQKGDEYEYYSEEDGWFLIELTSGQTGWIQSAYAKEK